MYIKKHEGDLKQSKQAKDIVTKYRTYLEKVFILINAKNF